MLIKLQHASHTDSRITKRIGRFKPLVMLQLVRAWQLEFNDANAMRGKTYKLLKRLCSNLSLVTIIAMSVASLSLHQHQYLHLLMMQCNVGQSPQTLKKTTLRSLICHDRCDRDRITRSLSTSSSASASASTFALASASPSEWA